MSRTFPIKDRDFHVSSLRALDQIRTHEIQILVTWHSTAINYLDYGAFHDLGGPAAEVDGKPVLIKREFQLGIDDDGYPFMRYFLESPESSQTLERFDVAGVTLRDVTIVAKPDRISYRIPDTIDQGGAIRQFKQPFKIGQNDLTPPVLKSDIQEACEAHVKEGGLSE